ncbi:MAG: 50S ribosomal protein L19 [Patescibacteria group bacterium]
MSKKLENFNKKKKKDLPEINTGDRIRVHKKVGSGDNERTEITEGLVIARKHGKELSATITVREVVDKVGVEKIFPLHSPKIEKIEVVKKGKARKSKLYFLRNKTRKEIRKKLKAN